MSVELTTNELNELKSQGFSEQEINQAVEELKTEDINESYGQPLNRHSTGINSSFSGNSNLSDLARWQLELNDLIERADHNLRGDIIKVENGQMVWAKNPHPELNALNDHGVHLLMVNVSLYVNRHIILGDYEAEEVDLKALDFGKKIRDLIFMKYEEMGMDTEDKRKEYAIIVMNLTNIIHASYKRALRGGERRSLREIISINQNHQSTAQGGITVNASGQPQRTRGLLNPMRYIAGKYV